jgi:hypothetical protein
MKSSAGSANFPNFPNFPNFLGSRNAGIVATARRVRGRGEQGTPRLTGGSGADQPDSVLISLLCDAPSLIDVASSVAYDYQIIHGPLFLYLRDFVSAVRS